MVDFVIIGCGIVGLHIASALSRQHPEKQIWVLDQEPDLFHHTSARNSGVLHAGLYYPNGSLKHLLCRRGLELWRQDWADVPQSQCGKYVFATTSTESAKLEQLMAKAAHNGVQGLRWATAQEIASLSPFCKIDSAFFSPETGIIDASQALQHMLIACEQRGVHIINPCRVTEVSSQPEDGFSLTTDRGEMEVAHVINAAGLGAVAIRELLGLNDLEAYYVKGHYYRYTGDFWDQHLLYPVPPSHGLGLGLHATINMNGEIRFGPDTVPTNGLEYHFEQQLEAVIPSLRELYPHMNMDKLQLDFCGIRPKVKMKKDGSIFSDFWIKGPQDHQIKGYVELCGIESPGFTAAPAIAEFVVNKWFK